jgi:putative transposase
MHRTTFKYRLYPTAAQETALERTLEECRWVYNRLLEERILAYEACDQSLSLYDQLARLPALKAERPNLAGVHSQVLQNVGVRLHLAMKAFFRRVKAGERPGFPRFRGRGWYDSFCYPQEGRVGGYWVVGESHVHLSKIGDVALEMHRPVEGTIKTCCVRRTATGKWFVAFSCAVDDRPLPATAAAAGIDMGLASFATLSTGEQIANPRFFRRDEKDLARAQRHLSRQDKGDARTRTPAWRKRKKAVAHIYERITHRRQDFAHQHSRRIVNQYGVVAVEDLSINKMVHNHCLAKSISDAAWRQFRDCLAYKAASAGRQFVTVNPAYTSQDCSRCRHRQMMAFDQRVYHCSCCGLALDRDHNAALNILAIGLDSLGLAPRSSRL